MSGSEPEDDGQPGERPGSVSRRGLIGQAARLAAGASLASAFDLNEARTMAGTPTPSQPPVPFPSMTASPFPDAPMTYEGLTVRARALAAKPYQAPPEDLPTDLASLDYDAYQAIRFRPERTIALSPLFSLQPFHRGFLQRKRVVITLQRPDRPPEALAYDPSAFDLGPRLEGRTFPAALGHSGFRLATAFDPARSEVQEEFLVFLGASYFRLRGRGQVYGLSARGLAVNTFGPGTEEFPDFTEFWIVAPVGNERTITILALLDSPSVAGAYRFTVSPDAPARIGMSASLHPRRRIVRLGLAPLTSMFLHGENGPGARGAVPFDDFRPQVHDSDGLCIQTPGDRLWRPLVNGRREPRISAFRAAPLEGFGLLQRERRFAAYLDVQARHEDRPGLWVRPEPGAAFSAGAVQLFEIPAREEYVDNIVAAFVPEAAPEPGQALDLAYTLTCIGTEPDPLLPQSLARVVSTRVGSAERLRPSNPPRPARRLFAIDFEGESLPADPSRPIAVALSASAGAFVEPYAERVPQTGGWRLYAEYRPPDLLPEGDVVLRARLSLDGRPITETWDAVA